MVAGAQAVVDEGQFAVAGVEAAEVVVGGAGGGEDPAHRAHVVDHAGRGGAGPGVVDVQRDALGDGDPGLLDAAVGGEDHGPGGGDPGLGAVAEQAGEPVVGEPGGGGLHEQEMLGGGGACGDAQPGPGHGR